MARTRKRRKKKLEDLKPRNAELACILKNDPARIQERVITPKKNKKRPRTSNRANKEQGDAKEALDR
jgi:hypothetical protein